jgi:preprotein translocase subunit SecE
MQLVIKISGKKGSGKDTFGDMLDEMLHSKYEVLNTSFAKTLKEFLISTKIVDRSQAYIQQFKNELTKVEWKNMPLKIRWKYNFWWRFNGRKFLTAREVMQIYGTDICRNMLLDSIWVDSLNYEVEQFMNTHDDAIVIVRDTRFPNEAERCGDTLTVVVRVSRDDIPTDNHPSETALDDFRFIHIIDNNGSLDDLREKAKEFLDSVLTI